jgi:formylglycine-generating enzyme required for sulfatase activity
MGNNPSNFKLGAQHPVETVSWDDAKAFTKKLTAMNNGLYKFRLPTEAEWEYACRAGTTTPFYFGETISTDQANYDGNYVYGPGREGEYRKKTTPVGSFPPNDFGLYDMHGNVWEWCEDWYGEEYYKHSPRDNPKGPETGELRVLRGGSWLNFPRALRCALRLRGLAGVSVLRHRVSCGSRVWRSVGFLNSEFLNSDFCIFIIGTHV